MHVTCKGKTKAGKDCQSPIVDRDGYCPAHGPDGTARMRQRGKRGGDATRRRFSGAGLSADCLGTLKSISDAQRWLRLISQAVGQRQLTHSEGQAMTAGVREWLKAEDSRLRAEDLAELQAQVKRLKNMRAVG